MVARYLLGQHPSFGTMGSWLSRDGVDVTTATVNGDFLLRSELKNEQIILSGQAFVARNTTSSAIPYPVTLPQHPYIFFVGYTSDGAAAYPYDQNIAISDFTSGGITFYEGGVAIQIYNNQLQFINSFQGWDLYVDFLIYNRSIGL